MSILQNIWCIINWPTIDFKFHGVIFVKIIKLAGVVSFDWIVVKVCISFIFAPFIQCRLCHINDTFIKCPLTAQIPLKSWSTYANIVFCGFNFASHSFHKIRQSRYMYISGIFNSKFGAILIVLVAYIVTLLNLHNSCTVHTSIFFTFLVRVNFIKFV